MEQENIINLLNYKYKMAELNKFWNYYLNEENEKECNFLKSIIYHLRKNIIEDSQVETKSSHEYKVDDMDIEKMKIVIKTFFNSIDPVLNEKVEYALSNVIYENFNSRSVSSNGIIYLNYKKDELASLITLAHEVSHTIAAIEKHENGEFVRKTRDKEEQLSEIESEITEDLFMDYLINESGLNITSKKDGKPLDSSDIKRIKYSKLNSAMGIAFRAIDELEFQSFMKNRNYKDITPEVIEELSKVSSINESEIKRRLDMTLSHYCPKNGLNYVPKMRYDLKNGEHLSNESRFIYAYCFTELFDSMALPGEEKKRTFSYYLENAKRMSIENILTLFGLDSKKDLTSSLTEKFITNHNSFVENERKVRSAV